MPSFSGASVTSASAVTRAHGRAVAKWESSSPHMVFRALLSGLCGLPLIVILDNGLDTSQKRLKAFEIYLVSIRPYDTFGKNNLTILAGCIMVFVGIKGFTLYLCREDRT